MWPLLCVTTCVSHLHCADITANEWLETTHIYDPPVSVGQESKHSLARSYEAAIKALAGLPSHLQTQRGKEPLPKLTRLLGAGWVRPGALFLAGWRLEATPGALPFGHLHRTAHGSFLHQTSKGRPPARCCYHLMSHNHLCILPVAGEVAGALPRGRGHTRAWVPGSQEAGSVPHTPEGVPGASLASSSWASCDGGLLWRPLRLPLRCGPQTHSV